MAENKIRYGLKNLHYAIRHEGTNGAITYDVPKAWKGAKSFTGDASTEESKVYADDTIYYATQSSSGRSGTIETLFVPDQVLKDIFNYVEATDGGLLEDAYALPNPVALMFEVQGDDHATRFIYYNVTLSQPSSNENTKEESVDPQNQSCNYTAIPQPTTDGKYAFVSRRINEGSTAYNNFFTTAPTIPTVVTTQD